MDKLDNILKKNTFFTFDKKDEKNKMKRILLTLPGDKPIEEIMWEYINNLKCNDKFYFDPYISKIDLTEKSLKECGPKTKNLQGYKKWFYHNRDIFINVLVKYWIKDNSDMVENFINDFKFEYNKIARNIGI